MKKIRWSIIGAGGIADRRAIPAMLLDPQNEIVAVMDTNAQVVKAVAEKYNVANYFTDAEKMLDSVACDAVYIATPVFAHYQQAIMALEKGINVFMEKPIALSAEEGAAILETAKKAGKQLSIGYVMGHHNLHRTAERLVKTGKLGQVHSVRMQFTCWYPDIPGAWRQKKALGGGGCIMDLAVHCMELFHSITGDDIVECKTYFATSTFQYEVEDTAVILFKSKGGVIGHIDVNFNIPDNCAASKLEIYGTEGVIRCERRGTLGAVKVMDKYGKEETLEVLEQFDNWKNMPTAYAQFVKHGAPMPEMTNLENNLRVIAMLDAAKRSTLSGHYEPCNNLTWEI